MVSDKIYELCRPVLEDDSIDDEEKTDKLEELLSSEPTSLKGKILEDAVLSTLWQWKSAQDKTALPPPARGPAVARTKSPAPWMQRTGTPPSSTTGSPRPSSAIPAARGPFARALSYSSSPFTSPRSSPRLPVATPSIPFATPRLNIYGSNSELASTTENYGDYGSDTVDWLVNDDDASSSASFDDSGYGPGTASYATEMSPYDMLRSILQNNSSDEDLDHILEANGYDLGQAVNSIMAAPEILDSLPQQSQPRTYLIGKSMAPSSRPVTPIGQQKSPIVCRYWLTTGHCARADCRFAHEVQNHVCKYWLQGNCIAGSNCLFSHDPAALMQHMTITNSGGDTPQGLGPNFQLQDYDNFPTLQPTSSNPYEESLGMDPAAITLALQQQYPHQQSQYPPSGLFPSFVPTGPRNASANRSTSRPTSRHGSRAPTPNQPNFQDDEAFPSLSSGAATKVSKRHHGKRGGHGHYSGAANTFTPGAAMPATNLADVVRMAPAPPTPPTAREAMRRGLRANKSFTSTTSLNTLSNIPAPTSIPWLETGASANLAYLKARQEAFKHGGLRNKFLQSAAQAWNRNDARGAKALSLRGQNENALMREKHREAARLLYEERNRGSREGKEVYIDLHGLHPEEAVGYLNDCLKEQSAASRPVYAICGTGHHSKGGKDKVGKAIRTFLSEWRYTFREFSVPGDRNNVGGILGIDPGSFDRGVGISRGDGADSGVGLDEAGRLGAGDTKVTLVREDPRKVMADDEDVDDD